MCSMAGLAKLKSTVNLACNYEEKTPLANQGTMKGQTELYSTLKAAGKESEFWKKLDGGCNGKRWHAKSDRCQEWKFQQIVAGNGDKVSDRSPESMAALSRKLSDIELFLKCAGRQLGNVMNGDFVRAIRNDMGKVYTFIEAAAAH